MIEILGVSDKNVDPTQFVYHQRNDNLGLQYCSRRIYISVLILEGRCLFSTPF